MQSGVQCFYRVWAPYHKRPSHLAAESEVFPYLFNNTLNDSSFNTFTFLSEFTPR